KQLEYAILAEKRTHQLRVISIESLLSLAELKGEYDLSHQDVLEILRPSGPKIDPVVDLIAGLVAEQGDSKPPGPAAPPETGKQLPKEVCFWLTPVKSTEEQTAEECIRILV